MNHSPENTSGSMDERGNSTTGHQRAMNYQRIPSPPRVWIPPPPRDASGRPILPVASKTAQDYESNAVANSDFLKSFTLDRNPSRDNVTSWRYEERHKAQPVLPFLYLGPVVAARDKKFLTDNQITMCLGVRGPDPAFDRFLSPKAPVELGLEVAFTESRPTPSLVSIFGTFIELINNHLSANERNGLPGQEADPAPEDQERNNMPTGRVLVFDESGNERAAAACVAYVMAMYSCSAVEAIQTVQAQRFCIALSDQLISLLHSYEVILKAKRDVASHDTSWRLGGLEAPSRGATPDRRSSTKRTLDDDDEEMEDADDGYNHGQRVGQAPFHDSS